MCVQSVPFDNLARNGDGSWVCPHCQGSFSIKRSLYYRKHWAGRCQVPPEQGTTEQGTTEQGTTEQDDWTERLAAEIAEEPLQQALMQCLSTEQQEQLCALLEDYAERFTARVQELQLQPAEVEDGMADDAVGSSSKQRIDKLQEEAQEWLYDKARLSSLEANLQLFAWRSEHGIKVGPSMCVTHCCVHARWVPTPAHGCMPKVPTLNVCAVSHTVWLTVT